MLFISGDSEISSGGESGPVRITDPQGASDRRPPECAEISSLGGQQQADPPGYRGKPGFCRDQFRIIHLCGRGHLDASLEGREGYAQFEYVQDELKDLFALTDLVLSRAGANSICELLALRKPNLLIPLSAAASRGDQILNADSYQKQGYSLVLKEESLTPESLLSSLRQLWTDRKTYVAAMEKSSQSSAIDIIMGLITETA